MTVPMETVRDRIWLWGHPAGCHTLSREQWGLEGRSTIEPVAAARHMGIRNVMMVRYELEPQPPFTEYARPFAELDRVVWSIEGGGGADVDAALALQGTLPNLRGLMLDDYFGRVPRSPMWLAANDVTFPVHLTLTLAEPAPVKRIELTQSDWLSGDYRTARFAIDCRAEADAAWEEVAAGALPPEAGRSLDVHLRDAAATAALRVRVLGTHDTSGARSCGLSRVRLFDAEGTELNEGIAASADSEYEGHPAGNVLASDPDDDSEFSLASLRRLRARLAASQPPLDLWVVLYTNELGSGALATHLPLCDVIALWTWRAEDLDRLEAEMDRLDQVAGAKRKVLGLYMWDYGAHAPMPLEAMERQCATGLRWLREGRIEGLIFLASCITDLGLPAVEYSREWIARHGDTPLAPTAK